jgi:nucleoside triphosphate pyrophosphatase
MLVLASTSPTRRKVLEQAGIAYRAIAPGVDEEAAKAAFRAEGFPARDLADALAELKARGGWMRTREPVLGCDQTLELDGEVFDKPGDLANLRDQLVRLRGRMHKLHSAVVLVENGEPTWREVVSVNLTMRSFSDAFLDAYVAAEGDSLLGSVGGYRIEGPGVQLFSRIVGDHFAILGLPLIGLLEALRLRGLAAT